MSTRLAAACCAAALLSGCQTTEVPNVSPIVGTIVQIVPEQVQNYAVQACGYLPTAQTVADLAAVWTGVQVPDIARQIAAEICAAVLAPKPAARSTRTVITVRGVQVTGAFVR
jgi:hypothetical protein